MNTDAESMFRRSKIRIVWIIVLLTISFGPPLFRNLAAPGPQTDSRPDALILLKKVSEKYANATSYRIESNVEEEFGNEFSKQWSKSLQTSVVAPGNKYRFEARAASDWWILVSDGETEWLYQPTAAEYKKQAAPTHGPSRLKSSGRISFYALEQAQNAVKNLVELPSSAKSSSYLPDEYFASGDEQISCYVIHATEKYRPGWTPNITASFTVWVDKKSLAVRKLQERLEGALIVGQPQTHEIGVTTTTYQRADVDNSQIPLNIFTFIPPSGAKLVTEFQTPTLTRATSVGKTAPDVTLDSPDGKKVSLKSFQGRPVLLDFWATWCAPCVASLPSLARLYDEASKHGLVMLGIDEDGEAKTATQFLAKNQHDWPNFHDDGEVIRRFPNQGIPHLVLIGSTGMVVFAESSFDEGELRAAIAKLGPQFISLGKASHSRRVP